MKLVYLVPFQGTGCSLKDTVYPIFLEFQAWVDQVREFGVFFSGASFREVYVIGMISYLSLGNVE